MGAAGILGIDLAHQIQLVAAQIADGISDDVFRFAICVHFRGIDQIHADPGPVLQTAYLSMEFGVILTHLPGALTQLGHE